MDVFISKAWGPPGYESGSGGDPILASPYLDFVSDYIEKYDIKSVLDLGCGDGRLVEALDLHGAEYTGLDIKYGHNILVDPLPDADLVLIKDVLQHWSNQDIHSMLAKLKTYKHVLITNSCNTRTNEDIITGDWRSLDLSAEPFNWPVTEVFRWYGDEEKSVVTL